MLRLVQRALFEARWLDSALWNHQGLLSLSLLLSEAAQAISPKKEELASSLAGTREQGKIRRYVFLSSNPPNTNLNLCYSDCSYAYVF